MRTFRGHNGFVQSLAFSPAGSLLVTGASDGRVIVWDALTGGIVHETEADGENIGAVAFYPEGKHLAAGSHEGHVRVLGLEPALSEVSSWGGQGRITGLAFSPDGETLAWSSYDGWSKTLAWTSLDGWFANGRITPASLESAMGQIFTLRISPDGRTVAVAGTGDDVLLYEIDAPTDPFHLPHGDRQGVWSLAYSPDGRTLAAAMGGGVQLWDVARQRLVDQWKDHDDVTTGVAISPDGSRLLTCSWDGTARLYEFDPFTRRRGPIVGCYDWQMGRLFDVAISPDGTLAIAGGDEGDHVVAWDID